MMLLKKLTIIMALVLALAARSKADAIEDGERPAEAARPSDAEIQSKEIADFVDGQTFLVECLNLSRIDLDQLVQAMKDVGIPSPETVKPVLAPWRQAVLDAGGERVYAFVSHNADQREDVFV